MTHLMIENLEGRELMSGDVMSSLAPPVGRNFGSQIGSLNWATIPSGIAMDGSQIGSLAWAKLPSGIAMDGVGPVPGFTEKNEVGVEPSVTDAAFANFEHRPRPNGIIAILIG
jgi:hypothetical protein